MLESKEPDECWAINFGRPQKRNDQCVGTKLLRPQGNLLKGRHRGSRNSGPEDAAIFSSTPLSDETDQISEVYFSPKAYELAKLFLKEYSGQFCEKPDKRKVDLVAGFPTARKLLD